MKKRETQELQPTSDIDFCLPSQMHKVTNTEICLLMGFIMHTILVLYVFISLLWFSILLSWIADGNTTGYFSSSFQSLTNNSDDMSIINDPSLFSYVYENVMVSVQLFLQA